MVPVVRGLAAAALFVASVGHSHPAEARRSSGPEERARFVALVRLLERDPTGERSATTREQLRAWMIEVPDIRFKVCGDLLADVVGNDYRYSREINMQVMLSGATLTIEHPGAARDDAAVYAAGVEGALRAYEALLASRADARLAGLDDLVAKGRRGELRDHIARLAMDRCKTPNRLLIAAPIGAAVGAALALLVARWFGEPNGRMRRAANLRVIVLICAVYYLTVGIALHFLEPEYDPRYQSMSDYAWGAYGWVMTTTFFVLGLAIASVAMGLRNVHHSRPGARFGFGLLIVGALFVCLAGVFRGFPLHDVASAIGLPSLVVAVLVWSWSFGRTPEWRGIRSITVLIGVGMLAAIVSMILDVGMPGLQQRAFLCLLLLWLTIASTPRMIGRPDSRDRLA